MLSFNGRATNTQLLRNVNVSSTWTISGNTISLVAVGFPYHGYGNINQTNVPAPQYYNRSWIYRAGTNVPATSPVTTPVGIIGFWLNGVAMYDPSAGNLQPLGYARPNGFHFNASVAEETLIGYTFHEDLAGGVAFSNDIYHYNSFSFANSWATGLGGTPYSQTIHGLADIDVIPYLNGGLTQNDGHSKILGFALDGYPVYGPYGYVTPTDNTSGVKRMASGYSLKNISSRIGTTASNTTVYPMGIFVEDYEFTNAGDLDSHNGRYCVTPDYPNGTYAYFVTTDNSGTATFPYVIGTTYYGDVDLLTVEEAALSGYPNWITPAGNLGKIQALQFFELGLQAIDPTGDPFGQDINYSLVAGKLPAGMQIDSSGQVTGNPKDTYSIDGVPEAVTQDRTSTFTVRAISQSGKITDRSFSLTVTGNYPPVLLTSNYEPLGEFLDGTLISIQLSAVDLNNDTLTYSLLSGDLPNGTSLSTSGLISGPLIPVYENLGKITYNFTIEVSDGKSADIRNYSIVVYNHSDITADNTTLTDDNNIFSVDASNVRLPILLTESLGDYSTFVSGNFFAFKFDGIDYDNVGVGYSIVGTSGTGWDAVPWDTSPWNQSTFQLPVGLTLDSKTGWMTGFIPPQSIISQTYNFAVQVYSLADQSVVSPYRVFSLTILSSLELGVTWNTNSDLGSIEAGTVSQLFVDATAQSGSSLYYTLKSGSRIPQGLTLLSDGSISGRVSFQEFSLDKGTTTFDVINTANGVYSNPTTIDRTYKFTAVAQGTGFSVSATLTAGSSTIVVDNNIGLIVGQTITGQGIPYNTTIASITNLNVTLNIPVGSSITYTGVSTLTVNSQIGGEKTFTLKVNTVTYSSYDNLYVGCTPSIAKRNVLNTILGNTDYFKAEDIYRPNDPYWGVQKDLKVLVGYGLTPTQISTYISAMQTRHYNKKFYFGDYHYATAKDANNNELYDVIYVDLIEDTKTYSKVNNAIVKNIPNASFVSKNGLTLYPNDLDLMIDDLIVAIGQTNTNTLPQWETSIQSDGRTLGFQTAAVLAYVKAGTGKRVLFTLKNNVPNDIKLIPFTVDRYILDNNLDVNFNLSTGTWVAKTYTTFDTGYVLSISPSATVDYAIDIPFDHVDGATVAQINAIGGLDGDSSGDWNNKLLVFSTQENYNATTFPLLYNQGWNQNGAIIPGYAEVENGSATTNKRAGVWLITVQNQTVSLTFQQEITINQVVLVRFGAKAGKTLQYSAAHVGISNQTVPKYEYVNVSTIQLKSPTTFDAHNTQFINGEDQYLMPFDNDSYLKYPHHTILQ